MFHHTCSILRVLKFCFRWFINLFLTFLWVQSSPVQSTSVQWLVAPTASSLITLPLYDFVGTLPLHKTLWGPVSYCFSLFFTPKVRLLLGIGDMWTVAWYNTINLVSYSIFLYSLQWRPTSSKWKQIKDERKEHDKRSELLLLHATLLNQIRPLPAPKLFKGKRRICSCWPL